MKQHLHKPLEFRRNIRIFPHIAMLLITSIPMEVERTK